MRVSCIQDSSLGNLQLEAFTRISEFYQIPQVLSEKRIVDQFPQTDNEEWHRPTKLPRARRECFKLFASAEQ